MTELLSPESRGTGRPAGSHRRHAGFTLIELILLIAIIGVLGAIGTVTYAGWRADSQIREARQVFEQAVSDARQESKRIAQTVAIGFSVDGSDVIELATSDGTVLRAYPLPAGAQVFQGNAATLSFDGLLGVQDPYGVVRARVVSGVGNLTRDVTVAVIPPLGKVSVVP